MNIKKLSLTEGSAPICAFPEKKQENKAEKNKVTNLRGRMHFKIFLYVYGSK